MISDFFFVHILTNRSENFRLHANPTEICVASVRQTDPESNLVANERKHAKRLCGNEIADITSGGGGGYFSEREDFFFYDPNPTVKSSSGEKLKLHTIPRYQLRLKTKPRPERQVHVVAIGSQQLFLNRLACFLSKSGSIFGARAGLLSVDTLDTMPTIKYFVLYLGELSALSRECSFN